MNICILYDCLFPWTVGGAERWYRAMAEAFAEDGHSVTYLTLRQWDEGDAPQLPGIEVIAVGPRMPLMVDGRRRILPPLRFGAGVLLHLLRHRRRYDHIHCASFPFFALLAAGLLRPLGRYSIGADWHEVWTRDYWREYLGPAGAIGWLVQFLCARVPQDAFAFSRLHAGRLAALGRNATLLTGEYAGGDRAQHAAAQPPCVVYAGRMIPEKRIVLLVEAFALARESNPALTLGLYGDGPERAAVAQAVDRLDLGKAVIMPGFVSEDELDRAMGEAAVIVQPSEREGYGMVIVEAAVRGVPAIVVEATDNAAIELIDPGENGLIAGADRESLAAAIVAVVSDPGGWRERSKGWYARHAARLSLDHSLSIVNSRIVGRHPGPSALPTQREPSA